MSLKIDANEARRLFSYKDGVLTWRERSFDKFKSARASKIWNSRFSGKIAGWQEDGYTRVKIGGKKYYAHRIIYSIFYGVDPEHIDHINGNPTDNRIENLRSVTAKENQENRKLSLNNKTGIMGVSWCKSMKMWRVRIGASSNAKSHYYSCFFEACCKRKSLEKSRNFHINHGRSPD